MRYSWSRPARGAWIETWATAWATAWATSRPARGAWIETPTTTRQANRWLAENGFYFTVKDIAQAYENAIHGIESSPMQRYVEGTTAVLVHPHFNQYQTYLNDDGSQSHELAIDQVPWLAYSEYKNYLVRVGCSISDKTRLG